MGNEINTVDIGYSRERVSEFDKCLMASAFWYPQWARELLDSLSYQGVMNWEDDRDA